VSIFDWLEYVKLADDLIIFGSEASCRSAVSRAYYGIFGKVRRRLEINGVILNHANGHQGLITWLENYPDIEVQVIGRALDRLRRERNRCDL
jgi:hypothetical protein